MKTEIRQRLMEESKVMVLLVAYLALFLGGFTLYRDLVLAEYKVTSFHYWFSLFEALVVAKIILIGRFLGLGNRYEKEALVIPTVYNTLLFSFVVFVFSLLEHSIHALLEGEPVRQLFTSLGNEDWDEMLGRVLAMFIAFLPLAAISAMGKRMGEVKLFELFFRFPPKA